MDTLRQFAAVVIVLGLAWLVARKLRSGAGASIGPLFKVRRREGSLRITDRVRLTPQHSLHMVSVGSKAWLVGCHPGGTDMLADLSEEQGKARGAGTA